MPTNIITSILSDSPLKIQRDGSDVAKNIKVSRVTIKLNSVPMRHMREDGTSIVDSRIIHPASVMIDAFSADEGTASQIGDVLSDRSKLYSVSSKGVSVPNMMAEVVQIKQVADVMSAIPLRLGFKQVLTQIEEQKVKAQAADSSLIDRGLTLIDTAKQTVTGLAAKISGIF